MSIDTTSFESVFMAKETLAPVRQLTSFSRMGDEEGAISDPVISALGAVIMVLCKTTSCFIKPRLPRLMLDFKF